MTHSNPPGSSVGLPTDLASQREESPVFERSIHGQEWNAFAQLVEPVRARLDRCIGLMIGDLDEATSIVQEAFVRGWSNRERLEERTTIYPWLRAIAVNLAKQTLEKRRTRAQLTDFQSTDEPYTKHTSARSVLSEILKDELAVKIWLAIGQLPDAYREAVVLHYVDGMEYEAMAELTGASEGALRARAMRARRLLQGSLGSLVDTWMRSGNP
jgi:RNA polymerase sigma-70 factor, ECF subfamily